MRTETLKVPNMQNDQAVDAISQALGGVEGVNDVSISLQNNKATVSFDESVVSKRRLKAAVEDLGFDVAKPVHGEDGECCGGCGG
ncbi:MAG: heavy-metal-associated domain-containing protein [Burkholderiaceae bacterium]|nr:heavy-metal-associated domain-containing protein [Burkholderiaceae bacterium]